MKKIFLVLLIFFPGFAIAETFPVEAFGNQVGNGGKGVVCRDANDKIKSVQLLDYYEADVLGRGIPIFQGTDYRKMVANALLRIKPFDLDRYQLYVSELENFDGQTAYLKSPILETPDSDHIVAPPVGCSIEQVAIQLTPVFSTDRRYNIVLAFWEKMTEIDRAGLVLHEIIYKEAIARGHKNSIAVRYLNALISANRLLQLKQTQYETILHSAHMGTVNVNSTQNGLTAIYLDSVELNWVSAQSACNYLSSGALPTKMQLQLLGPVIAQSPILPRILEGIIPETWTKDRDDGTGMTFVSSWQNHQPQFFLRPHTETALVLCISTRAKGDL